MFLTIFTPTYNRAHLLSRVYESLCRQTDKAFEWLVVDDGSVDDTRSVLDSFIADTSCGFPIRYYYQENGGKHRAINRGVQEARGELFLILDSDDSLPETSVATIRHYYEQIKGDNTFGGVCGRMAHSGGQRIGEVLPRHTLDATTIELEYRYHLVADVCEVYKTSIWREFPFPEIDNERFCPENLVLHRISTKYKMRVFDDVVYIRDYLEGGLTDRIIRIRMQSPIASTMYYSELCSRNIPLLSRFKAAVNYYRFNCCIQDNHALLSRPVIDNKWLIAKPLGLLMHLRDKTKRQ